jgi:hypothetical protein
MKLSTIFLLGVLFLLSAGCEQILEEKPKSFFEEGNAFQTGKDATSAINGVYNRLRGVYTMSLFHLADVSGEELEANPFLAEARDIDLNRYTSATTIFDGFYTNSYILIDRANRVIANVPAIAMDTKLRDQIVGEAKFLRALNYFNLVRTFGDVPVVTAPTSDVTNVSADYSGSQRRRNGFAVKIHRYHRNWPGYCGSRQVHSGEGLPDSERLD